MERQKKEMEDKISQMKISEREDRKKLIEERKTILDPSRAAEMVRNITDASQVKCKVNWTIDTGIKILSSITPLSNNRVAVGGRRDISELNVVKVYDIRTGMELDCVEIKREAWGIAEVKYADTLSLAVSFPYKRCIEFRDTNDLSQILYTHSVVPHNPWNICTFDSSFLLYEDRSKKKREIHWLDCNESKPKLLKEKSFITSLSRIIDMTGVQIGAEELIIGSSYENGIHCYSTATKSLKWSVARNQIQKGLVVKGITTDGRGHLFVSNGEYGNNCIQMFSVSDGQHLGCVIKRGEQGLGRLHRICWNSASHSLAVAHTMAASESLSMINMEY